MIRRATARLVPLCGVLLYVLAWFGQLTASGHAGELHVRCAEHGELSHLAMASSSGGAPIAPTDRSSVDRSSQDGETRHEHCPMAAVLQQSARQLRSSSLEVAVLPPTRPIPSTDREAAPASPPGRLLLAAPKTSPPPV